MHDFEYEAPTSLERAVALFAQHNGKARPLAGGTDLLDQMRVGRHKPEVVIDVKNVPELSVLEIRQGRLRIGAAVPCCRIYGHGEIVKRFSALSDSCHIIGGIQIQSRASMGGNICNSGPAADTAPSVIALQGTCVIAGPNGTRTVSAESFFTGPGENVLETGEVLVELQFPNPPTHFGSHYRRFIPRNEMDIAVVGVGAAVQLDESDSTFVAARIALGAVAPIPLFAEAVAEALIGQPVNDETIGNAAIAARDIVSPITDMRGTREYRIHVTEVLTRRVVHAAVARARGEEITYKPGH